MVVQEGELILICLDDESTYLVRAETNRRLETHYGVIELGQLVGRPWGMRLKLRGGEAYVLRPTIEDMVMKVERRTNIVYPKDIGYLLLVLGVHCGSRVLEIGTGSGALTAALAFAVAPTGRVYSYDVRQEHLDQARRNLERFGLLQYVDLKCKAIGQPVEEEQVDAVVLDIPTPWDEIGTVRRCLVAGGRLASLNPTFNQIEQFAERLRQSGFTLIKAMEIVVRPLVVRPGATRPAQQIIAHTEFLLTAAFLNPESVEVNRG